MIGEDFEISASQLCALAGVDPGEIICKFVIEDVAAALLEDQRLTINQIIEGLQLANYVRIGDSLVEASHWDEIIPIHFE